MAAAGVLLFSVWRLPIPGRGFTAPIDFGVHHPARFLANVAPETTHIMPRSDGYDAQWYAQLALKPDTRPLAFRVLDLRLHLAPPAP